MSALQKKVNYSFGDWPFRPKRDLSDIFYFVAGESSAAEGSTEDMPPLEGDEGDDASKMEEVD